eukprot:COSAG06_NODE_8274_length_2219_cov_2.075472_2_plen_80_part_00
MQSGAWFAKKVLFEPHPFARAPPARLSHPLSLRPNRLAEPHAFARAPLVRSSPTTNQGARHQSDQHRGDHQIGFWALLL